MGERVADDQRCPAVVVPLSGELDLSRADQLRRVLSARKTCAIAPEPTLAAVGSLARDWPPDAFLTVLVAWQREPARASPCGGIPRTRARTVRRSVRLTSRSRLGR
jgi:hypothetical protein